MTTASFSRFSRCERGAMTVEFAGGAMILFAFMAFAIDLSNFIRQSRDADRLATQIALAIAGCTQSSTCVADQIKSITGHAAAILTAMSEPKIQASEITLQSGKFVLNTGTMTSVPADVGEKAGKFMEEGDSGVAVMIDAKPPTYFAKFMNTVLKLHSVAVVIRTKA